MIETTDRSALTSYRADLASRKPLAPQEERELVTRWRAGDVRAGAALIEACLPFVMTIALEYRRWGIPMEDVVQEGNIGLMKAAARFDPNRGCRLVTYAAYWIRAEIRDYVVRSYRSVRLGSSKAERRALRHYRRTRERDPVALAQASGMSVEKVERLLPLLIVRDVHLDERDGEGLGPADRLVSPAPSPEDEVAASEERAALHDALSIALAALPARDRAILEQRYLCEEPVTLEEVGRGLGISKERVRQLEERAKHRVREHIRLQVGPRKEASELEAEVSAGDRQHSVAA